MSDQLIAGYHDVWWAANGVSTTVICGVTGPDAIREIYTPDVQLITGDTLGANTPIDGIYKGGSMVLEFIVQELKLASVKSLIAPFQHVSGVPEPGVVNLPGTIIGISYQGILELIPRAGTPAANLYASGGNGRRYKGCHIGPRMETLSTEQRVVAVRFQCFPFDTGSGVLGWWKRIVSANA